MSAVERSRRPIAVDSRERNRAIDEALCQEARDHALAHTAFFSSDEMDVAHRAGRERYASAVKHERSGR
jgi:hypothetical protein